MDMTATNSSAREPHTFSGIKSSNDGAPMSAIELQLFHYNIQQENFQQVIEAVTGNHFIVTKTAEEADAYSIFRIQPQDYCLVQGGMMYTSAGSIISELISRGFLIKGYNALAA